MLKKIRGVGIWTIDMVLLYTLERPDIFPAASSRATARNGG